MALGDSTAQSIAPAQPERGYVSVLAQQLRAGTGKTVQVINLGKAAPA